MKFFLFLLLPFFISCSQLPLRKVASSYSSLSALDISLIREIFRIRSLVGNRIWPGFGDAEFRFVFVGRDDQWAINVDPLPLYYHRVEIPSELKGVINNLAVTEVYRDPFGEKNAEAPANLFSAWSAEQTRFHFQHGIFFVKSLQEYHRTGNPFSVEDWLHISLHELFHTFQDQYVHYSPEFMHAISRDYKESLRDDADHKILLAPELKALSNAACGTHPTKIKEDLSEALRLRNMRWRFIENKYAVNPADWERFDSWAEGTARYAEYQIMARWRDFTPSSEFKNDPNFKNFDSYKNQHPTDWCSEIEDVNGSYWYAIGLANALILDKLDPHWKTKAPDQALFYDGYFQKLGILSR